ncbi:YncE family protein [Candidatus Poribacteria bacterium]|nr:YncE family protein [Candidatus Poribacteria bacterium]
MITQNLRPCNMVGYRSLLRRFGLRSAVVFGIIAIAACQSLLSNPVLAGNLPITSAAVNENPQDVVVTRDSAYAYVANFSSDNLSITDLAKFSKVKDIPAGDGPVALSIASDNSLLAVANFLSRDVWLIDPRTDKVAAKVEVGDGPTRVAFSPDDKKLYVANLMGQSVTVIDAAAGKALAIIPLNDYPQGLAVSSDGSRLFVSVREEAAVIVIDLATGKPVKAIETGGFPRAMTLSPKGDRLFVVDYHTGRLLSIDTENLVVVRATKVGKGPISVATSDDGSKVYVVNRESDTLAVVDPSRTGCSEILIGDSPSHIAMIPGSGAAVISVGGANQLQMLPPDILTGAVAASQKTESSVINSTVSAPLADRLPSSPGTVSAVGFPETHKETSRVVEDEKEDQRSVAEKEARWSRHVAPAKPSETPVPVAPHTSELEEPMDSRLRGNDKQGNDKQTEPRTGAPNGSATVAADKSAGGAREPEFARSEADSGTERPERFDVAHLVPALERRAAVLDARVGGVGLTPGSAIIVSADTREIVTVDTRTNQVVSRFSLRDRPEDVAVDPQGRNLYVTMKYGDSLLTIDAKGDGSITRTSIGGSPRVLAVRPDGQVVYVTNDADSTVAVVGVLQAGAQSGVQATINVGNGPVALAVSHDGSKLYCVNRDSATLSAIDTRINQVISTRRVGHSPNAIALSPDDATIYVSDSIDDRVYVVKANSEIVGEIRVGDRPEAIALSPDGKYLYCANFLSKTLSVINTETISLIREVSLGNGPSGVAVSPDGRYIYATNRFDNNASVISADSLNVVNTIEVGGGPTKITVFAASGEGITR